MKIIFIFIFLFLSYLSFSQVHKDAKGNKIKARTYNKKHFSKDNYFYSYTNDAGTGIASTSKLKIVKPDRSFWGSLKEEGSYIIIQQDPIDKILNGPVNFIEVTTVNVPHPIGSQLATAKKYYFPESFYPAVPIDDTFRNQDFKKARKLSRIKYRDYKFSLQALTIPLKFRKAQDTLTYQTEAGFNIGISAGLKWSYYWYSANKSFLGQKTNQLSFTPGILLGFGSTDIKAKVNAPATFKDRKEPIFSIGGYFMFGFNSINIGFAIGRDQALKAGGKAGGWVYDGKTWTGIIVALDILK